MFEQASRIKLRIATNLGSINVEDLWDLPLTSARGLSLDDVAKALNAQVKDAQEESFVVEASKASEELQLAFDIVKHIIAVKKVERAEAANAADKKAKKQQLLSLISEKANEELKGKTKEELEEMVAAL